MYVHIQCIMHISTSLRLFIVYWYKDKSSLDTNANFQKIYYLSRKYGGRLVNIYKYTLLIISLEIHKSFHSYVLIWNLLLCIAVGGTKLWRPPVEVTRFWRSFFERQKRLYWSRGGGIVWHKSCRKWFKLRFGFILMKTGAKTAPPGAKTELFRREGTTT